MEEEVSVILSAIFTSKIYCNEQTWNPYNKNLWQHSFLLDSCNTLPFGSGINVPIMI